MRRLRQWLIRLTTSLTRRHDERRLREDIDDHLGFIADEQMKRGLESAEARRQAVLEFGSVEAFKENYRDQQGLPVLEHLFQDVRISLRRMRYTPGFTAAAVATLALALGLTSAVMGLAYALFTRPLPVEDASRVVFVDQTRADRPATNGFPFSFPNYAYLRDNTRSFAELAGHYSTSPMTVVGPGGPISLSGSVVSANYFEVLRLAPAAGRFFSAEEDRVPGRNPVAVLSHNFWRTQWAEDRRALGSQIRINGTDFTVIGIAPEHFRGVLTGLVPNDVWIPAAMFGVGYRYCDAFSRSCNIVNVVGRLAENSTIEGAQAELTGLAAQLQSAFPAINRGLGVLVRPATGIRLEEQTRDAPIVALLAAASGLVLLVAAANVAGLLLARGLRRRREIAIRLAIGASRGRLIRLLLIESMMLSLAGSFAGLLVGAWATEVLRTFFGTNPLGPVNLDLSLDWRVAAIGFGVALVTGMLTGIAPALQATRPDPAHTIKDDGPGTGSKRSLFREGLIAVQVALCVLLLGASGLLVRSFFAVHRGPGFDPDAVVTVRLRPSLIDVTNERAWAFQREAIQRLEALAGVVAASPAVALPLPGWGRPVQPILPAGPAGDPSRPFEASTTFVGPRYFKALGVGVTSGREFDDSDRTGGVPVAILNETLARQLWPDGRAVGQTFTIGQRRYEIVGVAKDLQWLTSLDRPEPIAYLNFWQQDQTNRWSQDARVHIRVTGSAEAKLGEIRRVLAAIDPDVPVSEIEALSGRVDFHFASVHAARTVLLTFGVLTLVLSMIGLYAALAFAVGQRTREIAVRMALGASGADVGSLVFRRGITIVSIGVAVGLIACIGAGPLLAHLLYGVSPRDPLAILAGPAVLALVAMLAISLPAWRAARQNPINALRGE